MNTVITFKVKEKRTENYDLYQELKLVGAERFELPTLWSQTRCATRLRYTPTRQYLKIVVTKIKPVQDVFSYFYGPALPKSSVPSPIPSRLASPAATSRT